jgi:tetratricopeptide (TPR) repeat protein
MTPETLVALRTALRSDTSEVVQRTLEELDADSRVAVEQYWRGRLLARLGRLEDAVTAQRRALQLDDRLADAHYSLGSLLADTGQETEAMQHWSRVTALDPNHVDALYNLGLAHYNRTEYPRALECWRAARGLAPNDFEILKKNVQAERALGRWDEANATMSALFGVWQTSADPQVRDLYEVTVDQFEVAGHRVMASEMLRPRRDDLWYETVFYVLSDTNVTILTVQLESSQYGRERGVPYLLGMNTPTEHRSLGPTFTTKPSYASLKPLAIQVILQHVNPKRDSSAPPSS